MKSARGPCDKLLPNRSSSARQPLVNQSLCSCIRLHRTYLVGSFAGTSSIDVFDPLESKEDSCLPGRTEPPTFLIVPPRSAPPRSCPAVTFSDTLVTCPGFRLKIGRASFSKMGDLFRRLEDLRSSGSEERKTAPVFQRILRRTKRTPPPATRLA